MHDEQAKMSLGDMLDRITILSRKIFFGEEGAIQEHTYLCESVDKMNLQFKGSLLAATIRLTTMNIEIWNLENEMRRDTDNKMQLEEIGKRAVKIRDYNKKRVEYKNEINRLTGLGFREFKIKHRSQ